MANKKFWVGMLAMVLVFGVTGIAGAQSGRGTLTITGIPSRFNGMYAMSRGWGGPNIGEIIGAQTLDYPSGTAVRISNGRVHLPQWKDISGARFFGSHTFEWIEVYINDFSFFEDPEDMMDEYIATFVFYSVVLLNGSAALSFHYNDEFSEW